MSKETGIEWCDSTLNLQMGCDGCELWQTVGKNPVRNCYAGILHGRYGGINQGFAPTFDQPTIFRERVKHALHWSDLRGVGRPNKPWLDHLPRTIFLNDMGDTFTESLPLDWLEEFLPTLAGTPHVYMLLTKRPQRMQRFSEAHPLPKNFWPGTSITSAANVRARLDPLMGVVGGGPRWVSAEPLLSSIELFRGDANPGLSWVVAGAESTPSARMTHQAWAFDLMRQCERFDVPFFWKQWGRYAPCAPGEATFFMNRDGRISSTDDPGFFPMKAFVREDAPAEINGVAYRQMPKVA